MEMPGNSFPGEPGAGVVPPRTLDPILTLNPVEVGGPKPMLPKLEVRPDNESDTPGGGKS